MTLMMLQNINTLIIQRCVSNFSSLKAFYQLFWNVFFLLSNACFVIAMTFLWFVNTEHIFIPSMDKWGLIWCIQVCQRQMFNNVKRTFIILEVSGINLACQWSSAWAELWLHQLYKWTPDDAGNRTSLQLDTTIKSEKLLIKLLG